MQMKHSINQTIFIQNGYLPLLHHFQKLFVRQPHQRLDFFGAALEVFDAECVDGHHVNAKLQAPFQRLSKRS
jgi:hypothetical protein